MQVALERKTLRNGRTYISKPFRKETTAKIEFSDETNNPSKIESERSLVLAPLTRELIENEIKTQIAISARN